MKDVAAEQRIPRRSLWDVVVAIRAVVPVEMHPEFSALEDRFRYMAPEQIDASWSQVHAWLFDLIGVSQPPLIYSRDNDWKARVVSLWSGRSIEDLTAAGLLVKATEPTT